MIIEPRHKIPLDTAVSNSTPGRRALVQNLYDCAMKEFFGQQQNEPENFWIFRETGPTREKGTAAVTVTVTDMESGLFIQLVGTVFKAGTPTTAKEGPFLTYGKKYLAETKNPQLHNTAVKIWR
jgi:hypothetical protein